MRRDDRGSAAVIVIGLAGVLVAVAVAGATVGGLLVGQRRAAAAADLAALAAAEAVGSTGAASRRRSACEEAQRIGDANQARLGSCTVGGAEVVVAVVVDVSLPIGGEVSVIGRARAGPASGAAPDR